MPTSFVDVGCWFWHSLVATFGAPRSPSKWLLRMGGKMGSRKRQVIAPGRWGSWCGVRSWLCGSQCLQTTIQKKPRMARALMRCITISKSDVSTICHYLLICCRRSWKIYGLLSTHLYLQPKFVAPTRGANINSPIKHSYAYFRLTLSFKWTWRSRFFGPLQLVLQLIVKVIPFNEIVSIC